MPTFYRWLATPEDAQFTTSFHNFTTLMVDRDRLAELESLATAKRDEESLEIVGGLVIPLDVYDMSWNGDDTNTVEVNVLPELDGLCCFDNICDAFSYITCPDADIHLMIFEGEQVGSVWDGLLARVDSVTEVISGIEAIERFADEVEGAE